MSAGEAVSYQALARYYDLIMADRGSPVEFYSSQLSRDVSSVLDVGCGSGAVTCKIAERVRKLRGSERSRVAGIDGSGAMLALAQRRDPLVEWIEGDIRALPVSGKFDLVFSCYNTLQHVDLDGLQLTLRAVRSVLAEGGRLAFDIYRPNLAYIRIPQRKRVAFSLRQPDGRPLEVLENTDFDEATGILNIDWTVVDAGEPGRPALAHSLIRMWQHEPGDVEMALRDAGLKIVERYGDLDWSPYSDSCKKQVVISQAM